MNFKGNAQKPCSVNLVHNGMKSFLREYLKTDVYHIYVTLAKTEIVYPKNVGALVAMNFT